MRYSKWIVAFVIALNTVFAGAVLYVFLKVGSEPQTLITAWFAFTTGELWMLANIKNTETKQKKVDKNDSANSDDSTAK